MTTPAAGPKTLDAGYKATSLVVQESLRIFVNSEGQESVKYGTQENPDSYCENAGQSTKPAVRYVRVAGISEGLQSTGHISFHSSRNNTCVQLSRAAPYMASQLAELQGDLRGCLGGEVGEESEGSRRGPNGLKCSAAFRTGVQSLLDGTALANIFSCPCRDGEKNAILLFPNGLPSPHTTCDAFFNANPWVCGSKTPGICPCPPPGAGMYAFCPDSNCAACCPHVDAGDGDED
jgi:hypothetical protein